MFIAVVGITAGPSFIQGFQQVGVSLFLVGALATAIPLILELLMARYLFKFHPALCLGCTAGARTTTAALGAIQDTVESQTPSLGYTVTYAVGNILLIIWGGSDRPPYVIHKNNNLNSLYERKRRKCSQQKVSGRNGEDQPV